MSGIILGLGGLIHSLISAYIWVVIIAAVLSWVRPDPSNPIVQILYRLTEPAYEFVRRYIPTTFNGIDFTPLVLIIGLQIIDILFVSMLNTMAF